MTTLIRSWRQERRYRATVRELQAMSRHELNTLGIRQTQITRLAKAASGL